MLVSAKYIVKKPGLDALSTGRCPSVAEALLRPFVDLNPCERGPLCARGMEQYWIAFTDTHRPRFALQRILPSTFRAQFLEEAGLPAYHVEDPREVPAAIQSSRWRLMCEALNHWPELTTDQQCRLVLLLHGLCFYSLLSNQVHEGHEAEIISQPDQTELAYRRASARYTLGTPDRVADYGAADLSQLERIAIIASPHPAIALNAALKLLVHRAKVGSPVEEMIHWRSRAEQSIEALASTHDEFNFALLLSRFYRAAAFIPQRLGDRTEVVRMMDLAERFALAVVPVNEAQELLRLENLHPLMQSRTKEALWLGDFDLALTRAQYVINVDPYDSRTWLELGQVRLQRKEYAAAAEAYAAGAMLGPPASAIGRHMAGVCFRHLGQPLLAAFFFQGALEVDPRGISPHNEIQDLPDLPALAPLKDWSLRSFET
jgi:tetratricopeptide (TPR) repeat protein